jgi:hypothetical protein
MQVSPLLRPCLCALSIALSASALSGCNFSKLAADQTAAIMTEATPALDGFWDYDLAGVGTPGAIMQLEAFHAISPKNEDLSLNLAKAYVGYATGWVESEYEVAYADGNIELSDRLRQRARLMYMRAHHLALSALRERDAGIDQALKVTTEGALARYLAEKYTDKDQAAPLFWAGMSLGAAINMSLDQPEMIAELPTAKALVERVKVLDDAFYNGGVYIFLGAAEAAFPAALGGNPEKGKQLFEEGLKKTERKNHLLQLTYARVYAVNTQDRALYVALLTEIIEAPDLGNPVRLSNKVARRRAERYLAHVGDLF